MVARGRTPTHEHLRSRLAFLFVATLLLDAAASVLAAFRAGGLQPCVYVDRDDDVAVYLDAEPSTHPDHVASFGTAAGFGAGTG